MEGNLPEFLKIKLKEQYGEEITKRIIEGYSKKSWFLRIIKN